MFFGFPFSFFLFPLSFLVLVLVLVLFCFDFDCFWFDFCEFFFELLSEICFFHCVDCFVSHGFDSFLEICFIGVVWDLKRNLFAVGDCLD